MTNRSADIGANGVTSIMGGEQYRPYPAYKDSGVEWLGEIPAHWEVKASRREFTIQLGKMLQPTARGPQDSEIPYFKAQHVQWETVRTTGMPIMWADPADEVQYGVLDGDLLVCEGGEVGRAGIVRNPPDRAIIQNALHRVRSTGTSSIRLLIYLLKHAASQGWFEILCNRATIAHFTSEKFGDLPIPTPPLSEQRAIAAFLDRETAKIDALVAKKERLIELLQEKRTALISDAVTKGLDPDVPLKDSGVEWLGEIPAHWEVKRLKRLAFMQAGTAITGDDIGAEGDYPVFGGNGVRGYTSSFTHEGEFPLIGRQGALCGCVNFATGKFWASEHAVVLKPNAGVNPNWLAQLLQVMSLNQYSQSAAQPGLSVETIGSIAVPVALKDEQRAIAAFLDRETAKIDALEAKVREAIDRLKELRTALISAAVTGKIDVREAAA